MQETLTAKETLPYMPCVAPAPPAVEQPMRLLANGIRTCPGRKPRLCTVPAARGLNICVTETPGLTEWARRE